MTVSTATSFNSYAGNGSTTSFAYAFKIFQDSNLVVTLVNDTTGVETTQTLTTDYTVTGAGSDSGGNVVFGTAPALGNTVVIRRVLPVTQETNYVPNDPFPAEAHEDALDKLTMLVQQEVASSELAVQFPEGDVGSGINNILPSVTGRSEKLLKFGLDGGVEVIAASDLSSAIIGANYAVDTFTGTGSTTVYTLSAAPGSKTNAAIYIDGVYQAKANYSVSGSTLTFTTAPPLNSAIEIVIGDAIPAGAATTASAVSYTQGGTGAVTTNVQAKLRETVSVKDFGAVGDGVTDDTAAIQAAIDASSIVHFPSGTYKVTNQIELPIGRDSSLLGDGRKLSIIKAFGNVSDTTIGAIIKLGSVSGLTAGAGTESFTFEDIQIDPQHATYGSNDKAIYVKTFLDGTVKNCRIKNSGTQGIYFQGITGSVFISETRFGQCGTNALYLKGSGKAYVQSCDFDGANTGDAIYSENDYTNISGCMFKNTNGPQIRQGESGQITNCTVINPVERAITIGNSMKRFVIANNSIDRNDGSTNGYGISCDLTVPGSVETYSVISNNSIMAHTGASTFDDGIRCTGTKYAVISGNIINGTERYAISADSVSGNLLISANIIDNFSGDGINLSDSDNCQMIGNVVRGDSAEGSVDWLRLASGTASNSLLSNVFLGSNGSILAANDEPLTVGNNSFPDKAVTDNPYATNKVFNQATATAEFTGSPTLLGSGLQHILVNTDGGNSTVTLPDIDDIGYGQEIWVHKVDSDNNLTITADTSEVINDGTTSSNSFSNIISATNTGIVKLLSSKDDGTNTWFVIDKVTAA